MAGDTLRVSRHEGAWWEVLLQGLLPKVTSVCGSECGICIGLCMPEPQHGWTSHEVLFVFAMPGSVLVLHFCSPPSPVVYQRGDQAVLVSRP